MNERGDHYPGDVDDPFVVWQAKRVVWNKVHYRPDSDLSDKVDLWLRQEQLLKNAQFIKLFTKDQLAAQPWIHLVFSQEYPDNYQPILGALIPKDYRTVASSAGDWRHYVKLLLELGIADRCGDLKQKTDQLFAKVPGAKITQTTIRAINNFYYALGEDVVMLPYYPQEYVEAVRFFQLEQRKFMTNLIGSETVSKLLVAMDVYNCLVAYNKNTPTNFKETRELLNHPKAQAIKNVRRNLGINKVTEELEKSIAEFALEALFISKTA